ncbi:ATP-binding protein [Candidatus Finniella inopinata]|uniref:ATP-binding protein n=1 Tax=Candidatus Finniella inopinata TaxID=1696036 RepID=UPI003B968CD6
MKRQQTVEEIQFAFKVTPVCGLIGPRQCGKTTTAKEIANQYPGIVHHFDLEDERDQNKMREPLLVLENLEGLIIIDEIHHAPDLFKSLRVLVDQKKNRKFLVLGSASQELLKQTSESLAGRITFVEMTPFHLKEINSAEQLHTRGGFPLSYLAESDDISVAWRKGYIKTFLERDIPSLGFQLSPQNLRRFWTMLAHYHGQIFNASEIGTSLGINYKTSQHYLDILESTFMVRRLTPWIANIKKRQVKAPKMYFTDSGLLHSLLGINNHDDLLGHPKLGASWEGFAMEQIIRTTKADKESCFYWSTQSGDELDLIILENGKMNGFEFKYSSKPSLTKSLHFALEDLMPASMTIIVPGDEEYLIHEKVRVCGLTKFCLG